MTGNCVVVAERARAHIYTLEASEAPDLETSPFLVERKTLANPQHKAHEGALWEDTRRGAHREHQPSQGPGHQTVGIPHQNFDEHRDQSLHRINTMFARDLVADLKKVIKRHNIRKVVLCAEKQMLGVLRPELAALPGGELQLKELNKDLTKFNPRELHKKLAGEKLLPRPRRPAIADQ